LPVVVGTGSIRAIIELEDAIHCGGQARIALAKILHQIADGHQLRPQFRRAEGPIHGLGGLAADEHDGHVFDTGPVGHLHHVQPVFQVPVHCLAIGSDQRLMVMAASILPYTVLSFARLSLSSAMFSLYRLVSFTELFKLVIISAIPANIWLAASSFSRLPLSC